MKDQSERVTGASPSMIIQKIKTTKEHMDGIFKFYDSLSKRNGKLNELVDIENKFHESFVSFTSCLDDINCYLEDLHADDLLSERDFKDKVFIETYDNSCSGRG